MVNFCASLPRRPVLDPLVHQLVRSGTSIGAHYAEANNASSRNDFAYKIGLCRKEAGETMYWLRLVGKAHGASPGKARELWQEAKELNLIFATIFRKSATPKATPPNQKA
jgi:four helix bundle protein